MFQNYLTHSNTYINGKNAKTYKLSELVYKEIENLNRPK